MNNKEQFARTFVRGWHHVCRIWGISFTSHSKLHNKMRRDRAIKLAHLKHGYTFSEIGEHLGLHYTTASKVVNPARQAR